ncbi:MAG: flagellar biosynthesis protein FlhA [Alphaproteobacteria bacterium]
MPPLSSIFKAAQQQEILLAVGVVMLIVMFFVPLPPMILDVLIALNISAGLMILLTVLFINRALEFTAFPMLLLITTTFRLGLNISSTRLILSDGHKSEDAAGDIIAAFGEVIMGGNFVIGIIIFLILIIVNFVVITKGSGRIAEVAARFTLDSLPGKQMAIDADLNSGLITEDIARQRRKDLETETGFYGAMDGASKFVRGDAVAGLIITGLNIVVGIIVGTAQHDMTMMEAANRYVLLTVGDGLVAYIPALTISIAAGILVTKSGTTDTAGQVLFTQLAQDEKALMVAAGLIFMVTFLPGMPTTPFLLLAVGLAVTAGYAWRAKQKPKVDPIKEAEEKAKAEIAQKPQEEPIASILHIDTLRLELGYGLLGMIDETRGGRLTDQIKGMRRQMAKDIGFVVPSLRIQDNMQLKPGEYVISIKDIEAGRGMLEPGKLMAMDPTGGGLPKLAGTATTEPTFGLPAIWIDEGRKEDATFNGYTVVDNATVIVTHLTEVVKDNMPELLTRAEVEKLLAELEGTHGKLIKDLVGEKVPLGILQKVLQNLLAERVSIRDLPTIIEALGDHAGVRNMATLTELVRSRLSRQISLQYSGLDGVISIVALSAGWEKEFGSSILTQGEEKQLAMAPEKVQSFLRTAREVFEKQLLSGVQPILLTSPAVRPFARLLLERSLPTVGVLSQNELSARAKIKTVGTV